MLSFSRQLQASAALTLGKKIPVPGGTRGGLEVKAERKISAPVRNRTRSQL